jgi:hypothetical protein
VPSGRIDGRLRIDWGTLQRVDSGTRLTGSTAVVDATLDAAALEEIERSAEEATEEAIEPVLGTAVDAASEYDAPEARGGLSGDADEIESRTGIAWTTWAAIGLGIIGVVAAGWWIFTKKLSAAKSGNERDTSGGSKD